MSKNILGLDLGTNSIGWALIHQDFEKNYGKILGMGSRIIPMSQDVLGEFGKGNSVSQTAVRTGYRSVRRLRERHLLRRERLHRVLNAMDFLPKHYASQIDFEKHFGKFKDGTEPKLAYKYEWDDAKEKKEYRFIFKQSFEEMLADFQKHQPQVLLNKKGEPALIPYDWTIYYLRKKALSQEIEKEEIAWILLNFNQKRGYYQLRGEEEEENPNKMVEFHSLKIANVIADEAQKGKSDIWYSLVLENGWVYRRSSKTPLFDWKDKVRDFIVTTDLNDDGTVKKDREGKEKRSFRAPSEDDWTLLKKKTEQEIDKSDKNVGEYIYEALLKNPKQKIKGKLVRTIERKFYKEELKQILQKQKEFHAELQSDDVYNSCVRELYRNNEAHQLMLIKKDITHLLLEDIIFYQRPLRSQKSSINNCTLEYRKYSDNEGIEHTQHIKAIPKSSPYYQEFRIWQWLYNLKIYEKKDDNEVTLKFLNSMKELEGLFNFLMNQREVDHKAVLKYLLASTELKGKALSKEIFKYRWNYVYDLEKDESKRYPCNETGGLITSRLQKVDGIADNFLTREIEQQLWHLIYSVTDKIEYEKALHSFAKKHQLDETSFVDAFKKFPPFKKEYGSYSEKAIKKLLPLMRLGKYWDWNEIDEDSKSRIDKILTGEYDETIKERVREKALHLTTEGHFQGLQLWLAQYIVYGHHSEAAELGQWNSIDDIDQYLQDFKQHSLRNPIVEQVVTETLRVVKDIWGKYGKGMTNFFDEIHIELGREMKNTADDRKRLSNMVSENENTNLRIKALLAELNNNSDGKMMVQNVRQYSPIQQDALKIYEDGALNSDIEIPDDILKISKTAQPSISELQRYKLWLEQKYRSPYTGEIISLSKLFTSDYEIEHIIPQSRFFDDSFSNKVICEAAVNTLKANQMGLAFIKNHHGESVQVEDGKTVHIFSETAYTDFVKQHYAKNRSKRNRLLLEDIPEKMIERQMNDTRYISKYISGLLSNLVRENKNDNGPNSKHIIPGNGKITSELKQDWGLNDVWNELILPRFERLNQLTNDTHFTAWNEKHQKYLPTVPLELSKGFSKKRIDHRHHALDALVIACATRDHVNLLNNQSAKSELKRYDLQNKLRRKESYFNKKENRQKYSFKEFYKPWETFTQDARNALESIVISFKQNLRVINKATNYYENYKDENGNIRIGKDGKPKQEKTEQQGVNWSIRKAMHKEFVYANVNLPWVKVSKKELLTAIRKPLDTSFDEKKIKNSITDTGIQKILLSHLNKYKGTFDKKGNEIAPEILAFTPEAIEDMNKNIIQLNNGKFHQPILKVRIFEKGTGRFAVGQLGNKTSKYVEAAKGTNLFFAIYWNEKRQKRIFETIPLNEVIEHQKWRATLSKEERKNTPLIPIKPENGNFLFSLSPNDLVYVPTEEERENIDGIGFDNLSKEQDGYIYKVVSFTGNQIFFIRQDIATSIVNKVEFSTLNKMERALNGTMIKECCIKLKVNRLGNISKA